jgi:outer membrane protein assembly factor BamA
VLVFLLLGIYAPAQNKYNLHIRGVDKDSATVVSLLGLQTSFASRSDCVDYMNKLPGLLQIRGYVTSSIDTLKYEPEFARLVIFSGELYRWAKLDAKGIEPALLDAVGWREKLFTDKPINFTQVQVLQEKMLNQLENTGYPFSKIYLDSLVLNNDSVSALLKVVTGPLYKIDSIRIYGDAKISNGFLQRYLELPKGSIYSKEKLLRVNKKMRELAYVEEEKPFNLTLLATGSILNMYLKQKKSSQVNVLIGFLPNPENSQQSGKKFLLTGEANILLRNAFGSGETIGLNWQHIQQKSPRLNLLYQHPYIFKSPVGLDFSLDMYKKDSSYLNVNFQLGAQYALNSNQAGKVFIQRFQTIVSLGALNTAFIIQNRQLPEVADVSSFNVGLDYELNTTDYRFNPKKGNEFRIITSIGNKTIKKNNEILELKDPNDPGYDFEKLYDSLKLKTYQLRVRATAARYFPLGRQSTVKAAMNAGLFQSRNTFKNELFQLGGYKLLRGFDEESQYLSHFAIGTLEYRLLYLTGQNSYFYVLADGGWGQNSSTKKKLNYTYFGTGLGIAFETKAGIFNLAWAVGKRNDTEFKLNQSKLHFGFVNFF